MTKKTVLILAIILGLLLVGFGIYQITGKESKADELTSEEIKEIVSEKYEGEIVKLEYEKEAGEAIYEVDIIDQDVKYEVELLASTGEVIKSSEEKYSISSKNKQDKTEEVTDYDADKLCQAVKQAEKAYDGQVVEVEYDQQLGEPVYQVKVNHKGNKKKVTYNSELKVIEEYDKKTNSSNYEIPQVSFCEVIELASSETEGVIEEVELDYEQGQLVYEVKVENGDKDTDLVIDAMTKEILSVELDD